MILPIDQIIRALNNTNIPATSFSKVDVQDFFSGAGSNIYVSDTISTTDIFAPMAILFFLVLKSIAIF